MEQVKRRLEIVKDDAAKLLTPAPKVALVAAAAHTIPRPLPAAQLPTIDEIHLAKQAARQQEIQESNVLVSTSVEKIKDDTLPPAERAKQLWGVVRGMTGKVVTAATVSTVRVVHDATSGYDQKSFLEDFGALVGPSALYLHSFAASVVHQGKSVKCTVHISTTHICIDGNGVRDLLPWTEVASVLPSVALPTTTAASLYIPVPDPRVKPTALQVFTSRRTVWQFEHVSSLLRHLATQPSHMALTMMYGEMDRAWRAAATVPLPNVSYN